MKTAKRIFSMFLVLVMLITLIPVDVSAKSLDEESVAEITEQTEEDDKVSEEKITTEDITTEKVTEKSTNEATEVTEEEKTEVTTEIASTKTSNNEVVKEEKTTEKSTETDDITTEQSTEENTEEQLIEEQPAQEMTEEAINNDNSTDEELFFEEEEIESLESAEHPEVGTILNDGSWGGGYIWYVKESKKDVKHYVFCMDHGMTMYANIYSFEELYGAPKGLKPTFRMAVAMNYFSKHGGYHSSEGYADTQRAVWNDSSTDTSKHLINYANSLWELTEVNSGRASSGSSYSNNVTAIKKSNYDKKSFESVTSKGYTPNDGTLASSGYSVYNKTINITGSAWKYFASGAGGWGGIEVAGCYKHDGTPCEAADAKASVGTDGKLKLSFNPDYTNTDESKRWGDVEERAVTIVMRVKQDYSGADNINYLNCGEGKQRLCAEMSANSPAYFAVKVYGSKSTPPEKKPAKAGIIKVDEFGNPLGNMVFDLYYLSEYGDRIPVGSLTSDNGEVLFTGYNSSNKYTDEIFDKPGRYQILERASTGIKIPDIFLNGGIYITATEVEEESVKKIKLSCATALPEGFSVTSSEDDMHLTFTIPNSYWGGSAEMKKSGSLLSGYKNGKYTYTNNYLANIYFDLYTGEDIYLGNKLLWSANTKLTQSVVDNSEWVTQGGKKVRTVSIPEKTDGLEGHIKYDNLPPGNYYMVENMDRNSYQQKFFSDNIDFTITTGTTQINGGEYINELVTAGVSVKKVNSENDNEEPLAGAEFTLYASVNNKNWRNETYFDAELDTTPAVTYRAEDGTPTIVEHKWVAIDKAVSDDNGNANFDIQVPFGDYMIVETKAPEGYALAKGSSLTFTHEYNASEDYSSGAFYHFVQTDEKTANFIRVQKYGELLTGSSDRTGEYGEWKKLKFERILAKGIVFNIYDNTHTLVDTITTDDKGEAVSKNLPIGTYTVEEVDNGGSMMLAEPQTVTIEEDETKNVQIKDLVFENKKLSTSFKIYKQAEEFEKSSTVIANSSSADYLYSYPLKSVSGVVFAVHTSKDITDYLGNVVVSADECVGYTVTDADGIAAFGETLVNGDYYYKEIRTANNQYIKDDGKYDFSVNLTGENIVEDLNQDKPIINYLRKGSIKVIKTDGKSQKVLKGVEFTLYDKDKNILSTFLTDENGEINVTKLPISTYYIKETKTLEGYKLDDSMYELKMSQQTYDLTLKVKNYETVIKRGSIKVIKTDGETEKLLKGVEFTLYDKNKNQIEKYLTDENGEINIKDLDISTYYIKETKTLKGYKLDDTMYELTMSDKTYDLTLEVENYKKEKEEDTSIDVSTLTRPMGGGKVKTGDIAHIISRLFFLSMTAIAFLFLYKKRRRLYMIAKKSKIGLWMLICALSVSMVPRINSYAALPYDVQERLNEQHPLVTFTEPNSKAVCSYYNFNNILLVDVSSDYLNITNLLEEASKHESDNIKINPVKIIIDENSKDNCSIRGLGNEDICTFQLDVYSEGSVRLEGKFRSVKISADSLSFSQSCKIEGFCDINWTGKGSISGTAPTTIFGISYPQKKGYHPSSMAGVSEPASEGTALHIEMIPDEYNISLNYIDDTGKHTNNYTGTYDSQYLFLSVPSRTGYTFTGYTRSDGKEITTRSIIDMDANHSIDAGYKANKYNITFDADGGEIDNNTKLVTYDSMYGVLPTAMKKGYRFDGWYLNDNKIESTTIVKTAETHTLNARYSAESISVNLDPADGDCKVAELKVTVGETYGELPTPTKEGYTFDGWYLDDNKIENSTIVSDKYYTYHSYGKALVARWVSNNNETENNDLETGKTSDAASKESEQTAGIKLEKEFDSGKMNNDNVQGSQNASMTMDSSAVIRPVISKVSLKKMQGRKLKITVSGKNITGYQIQYSLNKNFSKCKSTNTTKQTYKTGKLKKKTYYVRARSYAIAENGDKVYSEWSTVKKIKIRK